ncbi:hypothetical protein BT93_J1981 [Corymbia citriodora subsp. variegata]|nr:hypothetical protein BT93_J1981 [Corymbia citriodora subsp. variegata]
MTMARSIAAFSFALLAALALALLSVVQAQPIPDSQGFISIDCGASNKYTDHHGTGITYEIDEEFIDSGQNMQISTDYIYDEDRQLAKNLRSFPNGTRNYYRLKPDQGKNKTYLIRARFWYGDYDEKNQAPSFDLYIDVNYWTTVNSSHDIWKEIMYVPLEDDIQVCLVNTGNGVPFISALELRALDDDGIYRLRSGFLKLDERQDTGGTPNSTIRYPTDAYDRIWATENYPGWIILNTTSATDSSNDNDAYKAPSKVLRTAQSSIDANTSLYLQWTPSSFEEKWIVYFYFVEIERLTSSLQREFTVSMNDNQFMKTVTLEYLKPVVVVSNPVSGSLITFSIESTNKSGNPPILNAVEYYTIGYLPNVPTAQDDVKAINEIKATYHIKRESWQGDPCVPENYAWDGLDCSNGHPPRIISLKLSSSNLMGDIVSSLSHLSTMEYFLTGNVNLCQADPCPRKKKHNTILVPVVTSVSGFFLVLFGALAIIWLIKRKQRAESSGRTLRLKNRPFKYGEVSRITGNFGQVIGEGGFGKVYLGTLDNGTMVAVKVLSKSSKQGYKEFQAEAQLLMIVHHKNLVSLLGYCGDPKHMALIYEYMANGNLRQHLSGRMHPTKDHPKVLTWSKRLQIAVDAAQGLDYLHNGCKPPIIHRDLKTTNILLNEGFQAKIADFGLSRASATGNDSYVSTSLAGTPGYLDPEFQSFGILNRKSDVYSFGIILFELITGRPPIMRSQGGSASMHILGWLIPIVESGDIQRIMDPRLQGKFDINSAWKVVEIAMSCTRATARLPVDYVGRIILGWALSLYVIPFLGLFTF